MDYRLVYENKKSKGFRRQEDGSGMVTAVKVLNYEFPTPADIAQFHNEFDIISGLKLPGIRGPLRKTRENNRHVLEMEWVDGENLKTAFRQKSGDIVDVLHIAIAAARALAEIHHQHIIHKGIPPFQHPRRSPGAPRPDHRLRHFDESRPQAALCKQSRVD